MDFGVRPVPKRVTDSEPGNAECLQADTSDQVLIHKEKIVCTGKAHTSYSTADKTRPIVLALVPLVVF